MSRIHEALRKAEEERAGAAATAPPAASPLAPSIHDPSPFEKPAIVHEPVMRHEPAVVHESAVLDEPALFHEPVPFHTHGLPEIVSTAAPVVLPAAPVVLPSPVKRADPNVPLSWELIASRCPQRTWKPTKGMLFLSGNIHDQVGTEEFRTLRSRLYHVRETLSKLLFEHFLCYGLQTEDKFQGRRGRKTLHSADPYYLVEQGRQRLSPVFTKKFVEYFINCRKESLSDRIGELVALFFHQPNAFLRIIAGQ